MRQLTYNLLLLVFTFSSLKADCDVPSETVASGSYYQPREKLCPGDLIFEDNFDSFDLARWEHENTLAGGGNSEFEYYLNSRANSYVENGSLHIKPTFLSDDYGENFLHSGTLDVNGGAPYEICTNALFSGCIRTGTDTHYLNPIESARIRTVESFSFRYGTLVARAKMPTGDWLWPAIWLLPRYNSYGTWPRSGEIDLLECRGNKNIFSPAGINKGTQQISTTLMWGPTIDHDGWPKTHYETNNVTGYDTDFHIYKLVWNSTGFEFYIDDQQVGAVYPPAGGFWELGEFDQYHVLNPWKGASKMAPFDQEFHILINLAVGGVSFFPDDLNNTGGKPWKNTSPTAMTDFWKGKDQWESTWNRETDDTHLIVDYVKVYAV